MEHPYRKKGRFTLRRAIEHNLLVRLRCDSCRLTHYYLASDLLTICGDVELHDIPSLFRCGSCRRKELDVKWHTVSGPDVGTIRIRKLVRIRLVKVYDWEDGIR